MGFLEALVGGGVESRIRKLDRLIETADYNDAEVCLLEVRVAALRKFEPGSEFVTRIDLAEVKLRTRYQQYDRVESPARRAFNSAKGLNDKDLLRQASEAMMACAVRGGRLLETVEMAEQWIAIGSSDFKQRVDVLITKGAALNQLGRYNDALRANEAGIRLLESMPPAPDRHERFVTAASGMGDAYLGLDDRAQAINCWRQAMNATQAQYGQEHPQVASIMVCIGTVQLNGDEIDHACTSFTDALEIYRAAGHAESMGAAIALQKLSLTYLMKGDTIRAIAMAREAVRVSAAQGPEMRTAALELLHKAEDAERTPPTQSAMPDHEPKSAVELLQDIPVNDRSIFAPRPATSRPLARPGRTNTAKWAASAGPGR